MAGPTDRMAYAIRALMDRQKKSDYSLEHLLQQDGNSSPPTENYAFGNPIHTQTLSYTVKVDEVHKKEGSDDVDYVVGTRQISNQEAVDVEEELEEQDRWVVDGMLADKPIKVYVPENVKAPKAGDIIHATYIGLDANEEAIYVLASGGGSGESVPCKVRSKVVATGEDADDKIGMQIYEVDLYADGMAEPATEESVHAAVVGIHFESELPDGYWTYVISSATITIPGDDDESDEDDITADYLLNVPIWVK